MTDTRVIATVSSADCAAGTRRWLASLRAWDWEGPVHVYTPERDPVPERGLTERGAEVIPIPEWYKGLNRIELCRNAPAILKCLLPDRYPDGTTLLYTDSSDVVFVERPAALFDLFDASPAIMAARPFGKDTDILGTTDWVERLWAADYSYGVKYNSGVILFRLCPETRMIAASWRDKAAAACGRFRPPRKGKRSIVDDQQAFNLTMREARRYGFEILDLPQVWNVRGNETTQVKIGDDGLAYLPDGRRVFLIHPSGKKGRMLPEHEAAGRRRAT